MRFSLQLIFFIGFLCSLVQSNAIQSGSSKLSSNPTSKLQSISNKIESSPINDSYHSLSIYECLQSLESNSNSGLESHAALLKLALYGPNTLATKSKDSLWKLILEQFDDRLVQILIGVATFSSVLAALEHDFHAFAEPAIILAILIVNAVVGVYHAKSAEGSLDALKKLQPQTACVLRDGIWRSDFESSELVPGDIIALRVGDRVPADARIIQLRTSTFSVDESSLTGESVPVSKIIEPIKADSILSSRINMVYSGTMITAGSALAVITGTGTRTEIGQISTGIEDASQHTMKTPLAEKLDTFANHLSKIVLGICIAVWLVNIPRFAAAGQGSTIKGAIHHAKIAVALGVAAIPEGLPAVVTLCLSLGTRRMAQRNVIVRRLASVETLGCTSVVCTDKTGTLTTNRMVVKSLVTFQHKQSTSESDMTSSKPRRQYSRLHMKMDAVSPFKVPPPLPEYKEKDEEYTHILPMKSLNIHGIERGISGTTYDPRKGRVPLQTVQLKTGQESWYDISTICALCNQAELELSTVTTDSSTPQGHSSSSSNIQQQQVKIIGEPTEAALRVLVEKIGNENIFPNITSHMNSNNNSNNINSNKLSLPDGDMNNVSQANISTNITITTSSSSSSLPLEDDIRKYSNHWDHMYKRLAIFEFTRERKRMSVLCRVNTDKNTDHSSSTTSRIKSNRHHKDDIKNVLLVKGAAELMVEACTRMKLEDGTIIPITPELRQEINMIIKELSTRPLRCVALAYTDDVTILGPLSTMTSTEEVNAFIQKNQVNGQTLNYAEYEQNMVLVGICGIKDPPRAHVAQSIRTCERAGIRVMMITGDSKDTAVAIAKEVHILPTITEYTKMNTYSLQSYEEYIRNHAFTTKEFFTLPTDQQIELLKSGNKVFCRAEPRDKQILITMLEKLGEVTAMTGDGVNDAPALKQSDIGIAMGIAGTEVAKQAADMILADDDFNSIISAVEEGRNIYSNMQAFVSFLLSCNIGEIIAIFMASLLGLPSPLSPLHLLWVNLVTDGPPATALGFNPPDPLAMSRPPRPRKDSLLTSFLLIRYIITGCYVGTVTILSFIWWFTQRGISIVTLLQNPSMILADFNLIYPQSLSLTVLVMIEMLKALSAVSLQQSLFTVPPWKNTFLIVSVTLPIGLHLLVMYTPLIASIFGMHPLTKTDWKMVLLLSAPILIVEEILKYVGRRVDRNHINNHNRKRENHHQHSPSLLRPPPSISPPYVASHKTYHRQQQQQQQSQQSQTYPSF